MSKHNLSKHVNDRVSGFAKDLKSSTDKNFKVNSALILKAAHGDEESLKKVADMGKSGTRLKTLLPKIKENILNHIEGNVLYNQTLTEIYSVGGKGSTTIQQNQVKLTGENQRFVNQAEELKYKLEQTQLAEATRHNETMDIISLQAWVDSQMKLEDNRVRVEDITNKPFIAQLKENEAYEMKVAQHVLDNGSNSDLDLISQKVYSSNPVSKLWNGVRNLINELVD